MRKSNHCTLSGTSLLSVRIVVKSFRSDVTNFPSPITLCEGTVASLGRRILDSHRRRGRLARYGDSGRSGRPGQPGAPGWPWGPKAFFAFFAYLLGVLEAGRHSRGFPEAVATS